jgi:uncharacterized protein YndB with AHSA1/START domain
VKYAPVEGTIDREGTFVVFRFERALPHPVTRVWAQLTEPARIERWLGSRPELDPRPGGTYVIDHGDGVRVADRVLRVEAPTLFEHTFWQELNPDATVTWELAEEHGGAHRHAARLKLTHRLSDADLDNAVATVAPGEDRGLIIARNAEGWRRLLDRLEAALGEEPGPGA